MSATIVIYDAQNVDSALAATLYKVALGGNHVFLVAAPLRPDILISGDRVVLLGVHVPAEHIAHIRRIDLWDTRRDETLRYVAQLPHAVAKRIRLHGNERRTLTFATRARLWILPQSGDEQTWMERFEESRGIMCSEEARVYCALKEVFVYCL